jgi:hypothetical protein
MIQYLVPPSQQPPKLATSLYPPKRGIGTETLVNGHNGTSDMNGDHTNGTNGLNGANGHHANSINGSNGANGHQHVNGTNGVNGEHHVNGNGINGTGKKAPFPFPTQCEQGNPTIVPKALLDKFHFTFLIRNPHSSIPSYYRCTIPPLEEMTGFHDFYPDEAGYDELRRFFDYARETGLVRDESAELENGNIGGPVTNGQTDVPEVCVVDADDLLDDPEGILRAYCRRVGLDFHPDMLNWDNEELQERAKVVFEKWKGFHEDAIGSTDLKPRTHVSSLCSLERGQRHS